MEERGRGDDGSREIGVGGSNNNRGARARDARNLLFTESYTMRPEDRARCGSSVSIVDRRKLSVVELR